MTRGRFRIATVVGVIWVIQILLFLGCKQSLGLISTVTHLSHTSVAGAATPNSCGTVDWVLYVFCRLVFSTFSTSKPFKDC